jgi:hypothetical protein
MIKKIFYISYNIFYQLVSFFFLLYFNTFINERLVPGRLMWNNNQPRTDREGLAVVAIIKSSALLIEAAILIFISYSINRLLLRTNLADRGNVIAKRTFKINIITSLCFIAILIWGSFNGFLWNEE